jgi:hypothetical protein
MEGRRFIDWRKAGRQLNDYETDPGELKNLAGEPEQAELVCELAANLEKQK